jgi:predicted nucleotidyltransferase component of viral defense system
VTDFLIERIVFRLVGSPSLKNHLIFKGGYVGLRCYQSPRYTIDLDAIAHRKDIGTVIEEAKQAISCDLNDSVWFELEREVDLKTQNEYGGICLKYRAGIGDKPENIKKAQTVKVDIGIGDPVTPGPLTTIIDEKLGEKSITWQVYNIETIIAEKLHCLISRSSDNSRSKDIFDLAFYLPQCEKGILKAAIKETFRYRGDLVPSSISLTISKVNKEILKRGWKAATGLLKSPPDFEQCFEIIENWFQENSID